MIITKSHRNFLALAVLLLAGLYLFLLGQILFLSVSRQEHLSQGETLEPLVTNLETEYLALLAKIDFEQAATDGFAESVEEIIFASRESETVAQSGSNEEI